MGPKREQPRRPKSSRQGPNTGAFRTVASGQQRRSALTRRLYCGSPPLSQEALASRPWSIEALDSPVALLGFNALVANSRPVTKDACVYPVLFVGLASIEGTPARAAARVR